MLKFCFFLGYRYRVTVTIDGSRTNTGYFKVALYGVNGNTRQYQIHKYASDTPEHALLCFICKTNSNIYRINIAKQTTVFNLWDLISSFWEIRDRQLWLISFRGMLSPGSTYELLIDVETEVDELTSVKFIWNNSIINPLLPKFGATHIAVQRGRDGKKWVFFFFNLPTG